MPIVSAVLSFFSGAFKLVPLGLAWLAGKKSAEAQQAKETMDDVAKANAAVRGLNDPIELDRVRNKFRRR